MPKCTGQIESIDTWLLFQVVHDVSVFVPRKHQAKVGDGGRYLVERENIAVLKLFHQHHFLVEPLSPLSEQRRIVLPTGGSRDTLTLLTAFT